MNSLNLLGERIEWRVKGEVVTTDLRPRSDLHKRAREIIKVLFPTSPLKEEVPIPVRPRQILYFDLYLSLQHLAIEVHGKQHFAFSKFFHKTKQGFIKQKRNDSDKKEWCEINGIKLVILPYNEDDNEWTERIQQSRKG